MLSAPFHACFSNRSNVWSFRLCEEGAPEVGPAFLTHLAQAELTPRPTGQVPPLLIHFQCFLQGQVNSAKRMFTGPPARRQFQDAEMVLPGQPISLLLSPHSSLLQADFPLPLKSADLSPTLVPAWGGY